jgi:DSF synthase
VTALRRPSLEIDLPTLSTSLEPESGILWARMKYQDRSCYTPALVSDSRSCQLHLKEQCSFLSLSEMPFKYLVWRSEARGVFSLGGDLAFFTQCVRTGQEDRLAGYAHLCIDVLHNNYDAMGLPVLTCALVTGDTIGGGLESMITNDIVVAEKGAKFGLPEIFFNLFPGMGGYSYLIRKIGEKPARAFVEDGRSRSAEEMLELGLIDVLAESGQGEQALRDYLSEGVQFNTMRAIRRACKRVEPVAKQELLDIVDIWVKLAMQLSSDDLRRMDRLARVQEKKKSSWHAQRQTGLTPPIGD